MTLFEIFATLGLDTQEFDKGVEDALADARKLAGGVDDTTKKIEKSVSPVMQTVTSALGNIVSSLISSAIKGVGDFVTGSIWAASDLEEVQNVVDQTFGSSAKTIDHWAKSAKTAYGLGEKSAKQYASTIGAMFKSMGLGEAEILQMSKGITGLAGDMASFYNLDTDTAFAKLRSGISGETEPLKQLGINMSVANLEAYALSQGIETTYEKMSQAEQVALRYNYIMAATADAQGDFLRTSGNYANATRTLGESFNELKVKVGQFLLPAATAIVNGLNSILDPGMSFTEAFEQLDDTYEETMTNLSANSGRADDLIDILESLEGVTNKTASEQALWDATLRSLTTSMPELSKYVNAYTGTIEGGTAALRAHKDATVADIKEQAKIALMQEKWNAYHDEVARVAQLELETEVAIRRSNDARDAQMAALQKVADFSGRTVEDILENGFVLEAMHMTMEQLSEEERILLSNAMAAANEEKKYREQLDESRAALASKEAEVAAYGEALGAYSTAVGNATAGERQLSNAFDEQKDALAGVIAATEEMATYRAVTQAYAREQLDSVVGGFAEMAPAVATSVEDMIKALKSQTAYMDEYGANLQKAMELGVDEGLLAKLSDGSESSAAILAGLVADGGKNVEALNAAMGEVEKGKDALAIIMADASLSVDSEFQTMIAKTNEMVANFNQADAARLNAEATAGGVVAGLQNQYGALAAEVTAYNALLASLGVNTMSHSFDQPGGGGGGGFASGLDYVPYNDFPSYLHKGEAVLTAREAAQWREGQAGQGAEIDYDRLATAVAAAMRGVRVDMDGERVGRIVTGAVSRNIADAAYAGRYA